MRSTFSFNYYVSKKSLDNNNTVLIMGRINVNGDKKDFSTKLRIPVKSWNTKKAGKRVLGNTDEARQVNDTLETISEVIKDIKKSLLNSKGYISAIEIRDKYILLTKTPEEKEKERLKAQQEEKERIEQEKREQEERELQERGRMLKDFFTEYLKLRKQDVEAQTLTETTLGRFQLMYERLLDYIKQEYSREDIPLKDIDIFFIKGFEAWIRINITNKQGKSIDDNTVYKIIQRFNSVMKFALIAGDITKDPFLGYEYHFKQTEREWLTFEELWSLYKYEFQVERLQKVADTYIFACFTGLAHCDASDFQKEDMVKSVFNEYQCIVDKRNKTNTGFITPFYEIPRKILEKYNGCLPIISNQKTNGYLKEVAAIVGIKKNLTFHLARHTFATTICLEHGVPIETIQKMLGHRNIETTLIYAKLTKKKLEEDFTNLEQRLNQTINNIEKQTPSFTLKKNNIDSTTTLKLHISALNQFFDNSNSDDTNIFNQDVHNETVKLIKHLYAQVSRNDKNILAI